MKKIHLLWLFIGIILLLGPIWGFPFILLGMLSGFQTQSTGQQIEESMLQSCMANAGTATLLGFVACPIGIAIIVAVIIKHLRLRRLSNTASDKTK